MLKKTNKLLNDQIAFIIVSPLQIVCGAAKLKSDYIACEQILNLSDAVIIVHAVLYCVQIIYFYFSLLLLTYITC